MTTLLSQLRDAPVVGKFYMVPVAPAIDWCGTTGDMPVVGPIHTDVEHFNFPHRHYHIDTRFLTAKERRLALHYASDIDDAAGRYPLSNARNGGLPNGLPRLARRKCTASAAPYRHAHRDPVLALRRDYGEPDAIKMADGRKLCPHRKVDLSQYPADEDGLTTCPLHGLRVRCG